MNAYVAPKVSTYLDSLQERVGETRLAGPLHVTTSNGGRLAARLVKERRGTTLLSGPAAGVIASAQLSETCGIDNVLALDIGGTSADIAVLTKAQIPYSTETRIGDFPLIFPSVDVSSVGAGGGSIARLDNMGVIKVGPSSAGAMPGPACYGRGGTSPTVTDAYLATGILDPENFLGGQLRLRPGLAREALAALARQTRYSEHELAEGVLRVATSNLLVGVARVEAHKGIDIREFTLLAYGGAGPTHACFLAEELAIRRIGVPPSPGTFCAWGSLLADFRLDWVQTIHRPAAEVPLAELSAWYTEHEAQGRELLAGERATLDGIHALRSADMRYRGQGHNLEVALTNDVLHGDDADGLSSTFHRRYHDVYGTSDPSVPIELEVFGKIFGALAEQMGLTIVRTAHTTFVRETQDFGAALATRDGWFFAYPRTLGASTLLGLPFADVIAAIDHYEPGDVIFTNDPFSSKAGCTHVPDLTLFAPVFVGDELLCFTWGFIHSSDIGGAVPGSIAPSLSETFQEGIRIPPTKLYRRGEVNEDVRRILQTNVRIPPAVW